MSERTVVLWVRAEGSPAAPADLPVVEADGATAALTRLDRGDVGCVVCPVDLPGMGAVAFVELLAEDHPEVPVVLVGDGDDATAAAALAAGASARVPADEATERVRAELARWRADRALDRRAELRGLVVDVAAAVAGSRGRREAERTVYEQLAASELYRHVWVGEYDDRTLRLGAPFRGEFDPGEVSGLVGSDDEAFVARAVDEREVAVVRGSARTRSAAAAPDPDPDSTTVELSTAAVPLAKGEAVAGVVVLASDRPDAFDAAERETLARLGDVVAALLPDAADLRSDLVHELRNPLGIATAYLDRARDGDAEALDRVEESLEDLRWTVENVLADPGGPLDAEELDLAAAAEAAWERVATEDATLDVADSGRVTADATMLDRLLSNLFRNAVEHGSATPRSQASGDTGEHGADGQSGGGVTVTVGDMEGGFYVADDGPGIPEAERDRVFDRGYTLDGGGLGVGLSLVERIAELHGWTVTATEAEGGGARFEFAVG